MSDKAVILPAALRAPQRYFIKPPAIANAQPCLTEQLTLVDIQRHLIKPRANANAQPRFGKPSVVLGCFSRPGVTTGVEA
ncbi:hypothetical protein [Paraburkholderia caffeinilytica]|uniref:hypothetical protein n=1 Tax=Paraburkholderia caffeinilytica TaxID=1761016 RepID=UPI003DA15FDC